MIVRSLIFILLLSSIALAHAPSNITGQYDQKSQVLTLTITHAVSDPDNHYIDDVVIKDNGRQIFKQVLERQYDANGQVVMVIFPRLSGQKKLKVEADCNKFGSKTREIFISVQ